MKNDSSITSIDNDSLGRYRFAKQISDDVLTSFPNGHEAFAVGIKGPWGSGKSTILNFLKLEIQKAVKEKKRKCGIIDFNPWLITSQEDLLKGFLIQMATELRRWNKENESLSKDFEKIGKGLEKLADTVPIPKYKIIAKGAGKLIGKISQSINPYQGLEKLKKEVDEGLEDTNQRLYIFVDDIDRLIPSEISQVLKLIKLNLNFKNTVFFIAYDGMVVDEALRREYGQLGARYLEKIIQVEYGVPEILSETIEEIFFNEIGEIIKGSSIKLKPRDLIEPWTHGGLSIYFRTLRDIYRFTNAIKLRLPAIHEDVFIPDFILLESIRIFDYRSYEFLQKNYFDIKKSVSTVKLPSPRRGTFELIQFLFKVKNPYETYTRESNKRFAEDTYYERYFSLNISKRDISESDLKIFLNEDQNREDLLNRTFAEERYSNLLRRLANPLLKEHYRINNGSYFESLFEFWDNHEIELSKIYEKLWAALINIAESFQNPEEGFEKLIGNLSSNRSKFSYSRLTMLNRFILSIEDDFQHELRDNKDVILKNEKNIIEAIKYLIDHFAHWLEQGFEHSKHDFYSSIFVNRYSQYFPDKYKSLLQNVFKSDDKTMFLARYHLMIDSNSKEPFRFDFTKKDQILPGNSVVDLLSKVKKINAKMLKETNPNNTKYLKFYEAYNLKLDGKGENVVSTTPDNS